MDKNRIFKNISVDIKYIVFQLLFLVCFFVFVFGINSKNLFLPWVYSGDGLTAYLDVQNIKDTGWVLTNQRLAAPFSYQVIDNMLSFTDNVMVLFLKLIFLLSKNIWFSVNFNFILNCVAISIISYFVMVSLQINRLIASLSLLTFALLPYYFLRGITHYPLSMYQFIPLGIIICVWIYFEDNFFFFV
jgi:phosphoglycerol transferase